MRRPGSLGPFLSAMFTASMGRSRGRGPHHGHGSRFLEQLPSSPVFLIEVSREVVERLRPTLCLSLEVLAWLSSRGKRPVFTESSHFQT